MANQARIRTLFVKRAYHLYPQLMTRFNELNLNGGPDRTRTGTESPPADFKSAVSAYSTTGPYSKETFYHFLNLYKYYNIFFKKCQIFL